MNPRRFPSKAPSNAPQKAVGTRVGKCGSKAKARATMGDWLTGIAAWTAPEPRDD